MGTHIMVGNGKGWEKVGECASANVGHAADGIGVALPDGFFTFEIGTRFNARTRAEARTMNKALANGWDAHTLADCRIHKDTGAVIQIDRHVTDDDGQYVRAQYCRTH